MKILLAIDGSTASLRAVQWALALADRGLAADFVLVNVQEPATLYEVMTAPDVDVLDDVRRAAGADQLRAAEALVDAAGRRYESEVAGGTAQHLIVELAENYGCELIVLAARGVGQASDADPDDEEESNGRGLGSVAQGVLDEATLPVVVVRGTPKAPAEVGDAPAESDATSSR
jgi:nucleotide-binding universal stress UspA family protein